MNNNPHHPPIPQSLSRANHHHRAAVSGLRGGSPRTGPVDYVDSTQTTRRHQRPPHLSLTNYNKPKETKQSHSSCTKEDTGCHPPLSSFKCPPGFEAPQRRTASRPVLRYRHPFFPTPSTITLASNFPIPLALPPRGFRRGDVGTGDPFSTANSFAEFTTSVANAAVEGRKVGGLGER